MTRPISATPAAPNGVNRIAALKLALVRCAPALAMGGLALAVGAPAHADTGTVDTSNLDSGVFNGVVAAAGVYLNHIIQYFGVPAILVSLAVSGWGFLRHIAKSAFH